jgi:hypothetical protein
MSSAGTRDTDGQAEAARVREMRARSGLSQGDLAASHCAALHIFVDSPPPPRLSRGRPDRRRRAARRRGDGLRRDGWSGRLAALLPS